MYIHTVHDGILIVIQAHINNTVLPVPYEIFIKIIIKSRVIRGPIQFVMKTNCIPFGI